MILDLIYRFVFLVLDILYMCLVYENGANIRVKNRIIKKKRMNVCVHEARNE